MGGHGGLNILPQKRWNVYNYENREKVRRDEEAAAKEEQIKREQSRKRDAEFRLERLRASRGLAPLESEPEESNHINLFEGIKIFGKEERREERPERKKAEVKVRVVTAEEERYRLGYGLAGKGVRDPWYLERKGSGYKEEEEEKREEEEGSGEEEKKKKKKRKKSLEELREERLKREKKEKEREREVLFGRSSGRFSGRR